MLIAFEGPDGTGKTSICRQLYSAISKTYSCTVIRNPYHDEIGKFISMFVRRHEVRGITMMLLYLAYFAEINKTIQEEVSKTNFVLLDRYYLSTYIYNCFISNHELPGIGKEINQIVHHALNLVTNDMARMLILLAGIVERSPIEHIYFFKGHAEYALDQLSEYKESYGMSTEVSGDTFNVVNAFRFSSESGNVMVGGCLGKKLSVLEKILNVMKLPLADITVVFNKPITSESPGIDRFDEICAHYKNVEILRNLFGNNFIQHENAKTFIEQVKSFPC